MSIFSGTILQHTATNQNPTLSDTLSVNGAAFDLSAGTVTFAMRLLPGTALTVNYATATLVNGGTAGQVAYNWGTADVATVGEYGAWWRYTTAGKTMDTPEFIVRIEDHSDAGASSNLGGVRSTMRDLIALARRKIGDPAGTTQVFEDYEIQQCLDMWKHYEHRRGFYGLGYGPNWRYSQLIPEPTYNSGTIQYLFYETYGEQWWEADAAVVDSAYNVLSPASIDYLGGRVTFTTSQTPPVFLKGQTFDFYNACADLVEELISAYMLNGVDFETDQQKFSMSQRITNLERMVAKFRARGEPQVTTLERQDLLPAPNVAHRRFRRYLRGDWGGAG